MKYKLIIILFVLFLTLIFQAKGAASVHQAYSSNEHVLAKREMSLDKRYDNKFVNDVFKDNILLTLGFLSGDVTDPKKIHWDKVRADSRYEVVLKPGDVFAFHDDVMSSYKGKHLVTTHAHFNAGEGFKSDGYLVGDGVCHFASLINWAARDAGLNVVAPTNHNFAHIPEVPREYGTAIYYLPGSSSANEMQNLYVENTFDNPVRLVFRYAQNILSVTIYKS